MRVLQVLNGLGFGGAETWLLEIVKKNKGRVEFDFLLTGGVELELDKVFKEHGCRIFYVRYSAKRITSFIREVNRVIREGNYQAIHNHEDFAAGWFWLFLLFRLPKIRIAHAHNSTIFINNYANSIPRKIFYRLGKVLNGVLATKLTGTSLQLMTELGYDSAFYRRKRIECLYCGSEPELFKFDPAMRTEVRRQFGFTNQDKVLIFIGRIGLNRDNEINYKNPEFAFELSKKLASKDNTIKFLFVGEKDRLGEKMETEARDLGFGKNIFFLGKRKDVHQLLQAADLMIFTSTREPFGLVLVEAQFSSLPLVASDILTREAVVFPELFKMLNVFDQDYDKWIEAVHEQFKVIAERQAIAMKNEKAIVDSPFSIENSFLRLVKHYSTNQRVS